MTAASNSRGLMPGDTTSAIAHFVVEVGYPGKQPFLVGEAKMSRMASEEQQLAEAERISSTFIDEFWRDHMPEGIERPVVLGVSLTRMILEPDDYEWRRGS